MLIRLVWWPLSVSLRTSRTNSPLGRSPTQEPSSANFSDTCSPEGSVTSVGWNHGSGQSPFGYLW